MDLVSRLIREEDGLSTVEIILILVCLIALVFIFREEMTNIVETIFKKITNSVNKF